MDMQTPWSVENPRAVNAGRDYELQQQAREAEAQETADREAERVRRDMDGFSDWLYGQCFCAVCENVGHLPREWRDADMTVKSVPQLLAYTLAEGASKELIGMAMLELRSRYFAHRGVSE